MARPFRNMRNLLIPLLAVSLASCTEEPALHPELVSFDVEPTHNSVTLTARFNHADLITGATFNLMEYGKNTVMHQPAEISGNFLTAEFRDLTPNYTRYFCSVSWTSASSERESQTYSFYTDPYPMPKVTSFTAEPGARDALVRFRFADAEYLRTCYIFCWKDGTDGAYNTVQSSLRQEGDEYICTLTNLAPETFYVFHINFSNLGAQGERYSRRFKTLPE